MPGYEAKVIDDDGRECRAGTVGRLAVRGPTGCRYLADTRQTKYVQNGWNVTGDTYLMDADGYFWYQARSDDMIISAGYNIAGPEVESALLTHPAVAECGVVGVADEERGQIVKAYVVLRAGHNGDAAMARTLQDHVKANIAPYKYPRAVEFVADAAEDADRQAATLRTAQDRRRTGRSENSRRRDQHHGTRNQRCSSSRPTDDELPRTLAAAGLAAPAGLRQRHDGEGPRRRHRRRGRLGRDGQFSRDVRRAGAADLFQHPENSRPKAAPGRSTSCG